jgi:hypothetical protein
MAGVFWFPTKLAKYIAYGAGWASTAMCDVMNGDEVFTHHFTSHPFPIKYTCGEDNFKYRCIWRHGVHEITECIVIIHRARLDEAVRVPTPYLSPIQLPSWVR